MLHRNYLLGETYVDPSIKLTLINNPDLSLSLKLLLMAKIYNSSFSRTVYICVTKEL